MGVDGRIKDSKKIGHSTVTEWLLLVASSVDRGS